MAETATLARPYARAIFDLAQAGGTFADWSARLAGLGDAVRDPQVEPWIGHPALLRGALADVLIEVAGSDLDEHGANFVRLLAENGRLKLVPAIAAQYEALRADAEQRVDVEVVSASPVAKSEREALSAAIKKRLERDIRVTWSVDETLIAGAVVRCGDLVIDGSFEAGLNQLQLALTA